jgi:outer membrane protein
MTGCRRQAIAVAPRLNLCLPSSRKRAIFTRPDIFPAGAACRNEVNMRSIRGIISIALLLAATAAVPAMAATDAPSAAVAVPSSAAPSSAVSASPEQKKVESAPASQPAQAIRIGYVDITRIGNESVPGKAAQARFKAKADKYQSQITAKQKQLEKQKAAIEAKLPSMLPEQRAAKAREFEKKVEEYRKFVQNAEKELKPLEEELGRSLFGTIEKVVADYGTANGFAAIVAKKELLYQGSVVTTLDVTGDILKLVNEKGEKK